LTFKRLGRSDRVFCLIIGGEPNAKNPLEEAFPEAVRFKLDAAGALSKDPAEPIAADARPGKDGKQNAKLKIIAGMLGVGLDVLKQRELHRRQRRLAALAAAAVVGMTITTALAATAWFARIEAEAQRERAEAEAETARQTTNFLIDLFEVSDPSEALGNTITAREILDRGARKIEFELQDQPAIQSTLLDTMGKVYRSLGLYAEARPLLERGLGIRRSLYGDRDPNVAESQSNIGQLLGLQADFDAAVAEFEQAIETLRADPDRDPTQLAQSLFGLAEVRSLKGEFAAAEQLLREVIAIQEPHSGDGTIEFARSLDELGNSLAAQGRFEEAEPLLRRALAMREAMFPSGIHPEIQASLNNLGFFLYETGRLDEAEPLFRRCLEIQQRLLPESHSDLAVGHNNLALLLHDLHHYDDAEEHYRSALDIRVASLGENHPRTGQSLNNLAFLYFDEGRLDDAIAMSQRAVETFRHAYPDGHPDLVFGLQNQARWLVEKGEYAQAEPLLDEAYEINQRIRPSDHPDMGITRYSLAVLYLATNRAAEAHEMAAAARETLAHSLSPEHWRTGWASTLDGAALAQLGRYEEAEPLLISGYEVLSMAAGAPEAQVDSALGYLVDFYATKENTAAAERYRELRAALSAD
jgi:tetratricopeptide (TPR) repeat protein